MRRLEGKHLAMFGQALFNQAEGCAGFCGNNKFGWLVTNNTLMNAYIKRFTAGWRFKALTPEAARIEYFMDCEFSSVLLAQLVGPVFGMIANSMVDSFCKRAEAVYG